MEDSNVTLSYTETKQDGTGEQQTMSVDNAKYLDEYKTLVVEKEELHYYYH